MAANPDNPQGLAILGLCLGATGRSDEARALLARLEDESRTHFVSALERARITAGLGDRDGTIGYLEQAVATRDGFLPFLADDDEFDFLRGDPRFVTIMRRIGIDTDRIAAKKHLMTRTE